MTWLDKLLGPRVFIAGVEVSPRAASWNFLTGVTAVYNAATKRLDLTLAGGAGSGDVTGPGSSVVDRLVLMAGTTGKVIKQSSLLVSSLFLRDGTVSLTGNVDFGTHKGTNAADGSASTDLATVGQMNAAIASAATSAADWKSSVRAATTANITLSGAQTIDGVSVIAGDRVLVKNQSTGSQNGIYVAAAGAWSRATDCDISAEVTTGLTVVVEEGTVAAGKPYILTTANPIVLGTTALTFTVLSSATAGNGLTGTSSLSVLAEDATILVGAGGIKRAAITGDATIAAGSNASVITNLAWSKLATAIGNLGFTGLKSLSYTSEVATTGATPAVNFTTGDLQKTTLSAGCAPTFTAPAGIGWVQWHVQQNGIGDYEITFPGTVLGAPPQPDSAPNAHTFYPFFWDGTNYHFSAVDTSGFLLRNGSVPLTATWAVGNFALTGLRNLSYNSEVATTGATPAVNFTTGDLQKTTLSTATATPTFTAPPGIGAVQWHVQQDATGGRTIVFPGSVLNSPPQPNQVASSHTFYDFFWDGANYHYRSYGAAPGTEIDNGNSSTADTINFSAGTYQKSTLTGNCTFTFTPPSGVGVVQLRLIQDSSGSRIVTWPATVIWPAAGSAPTLSTTPGDADVISFFWDGANYYGTTNKITLAQIEPSATNGRVLVTIGGVPTWSTTLGNSTDAMAVNGVDTKIQTAGTTVLHAVTLTSGREILGLLGTVSATEMPANTGDIVAHIHDATAEPTSGLPANGMALWSATNVSAISGLGLRSKGPLGGFWDIAPNTRMHQVIASNFVETTSTTNTLMLSVDVGNFGSFGGSNLSGIIEIFVACSDTIGQEARKYTVGFTRQSGTVAVGTPTLDGGGVSMGALVITISGSQILFQITAVDSVNYRWDCLTKFTFSNLTNASA